MSIKISLTRLKLLIPRIVYSIRLKIKLNRFKNKNAEYIFSTIYQEKLWGGSKDKYCSGSGTKSNNTNNYIRSVSDFIVSNDIHSILDIGCGDYRIMKEIVDTLGIDFIGIDIVEDLIEYNKKIFGKENVTFLHLNALDEALPKADLVTVRQVLQHLNNDQIIKILEKLKYFKYVLITEHIPINSNAVPNKNKKTGPDIRIYYNSGVFIDKPPFNIKTNGILIEYREDFEVFGRQVPSVIRTFLIKN